MPSVIVAFSPNHVGMSISNILRQSRENKDTIVVVSFRLPFSSRIGAASRFVVLRESSVHHRGAAIPNEDHEREPRIAYPISLNTALPRATVRETRVFTFSNVTTVTLDDLIRSAQLTGEKRKRITMLAATILLSFRVSSKRYLIDPGYHSPPHLPTPPIPLFLEGLPEELVLPVASLDNENDRNACSHNPSTSPPV